MLLTIGHSTRDIDDFVALMRAHEVAAIVDVRRYPGSRRYPWFGAAPLEDALRRADIGYEHVEALGGRRKPNRDSQNDALTNDQFRGYADHMATDEFHRALERLLVRARREHVCVMCAEAVPWRCHRSLLSDAAVARGVEVFHIVGAGPARKHSPTSAAVIAGGEVAYPARPHPGLFDPESR